MPPTAHMYGLAAKAFANKEIDWVSDTIKVMLTTSSYVPNQDTHDYKNDVTNEVVGTGYTATGVTLASKTSTYVAATNREVLDAADVSWTGATFTCRYAVLYDATPGTDATRPLIAYFDFGSDQVVSAATFPIAWDPGGIVSFVV
jgi:hypothetical protein